MQMKELQTYLCVKRGSSATTHAERTVCLWQKVTKHLFGSREWPQSFVGENGLFVAEGRKAFVWFQRITSVFCWKEQFVCGRRSQSIQVVWFRREKNCLWQKVAKHLFGSVGRTVCVVAEGRKAFVWFRREKICLWQKVAKHLFRSVGGKNGGCE